MTRTRTLALTLARGPLLALAFTALAAAGCSDPAEAGQECADSADCAEGLSCFEHAGAAVSPVCMPDCDLATTRLCGDGAVCTRATGPDRPAELGVCYLGGTTATGSECSTNLECELGSICVMVEGAQSCYRACSTEDATTCGDGETCSPLEAMGTNGFCESST